MIKSFEQAITRVATLGLPKVFVGIWYCDVPDSIRDVCRPPERYFELVSEKEEWFCRAARFVPLWEENREAIVGLDESTGEFLKHQYDGSVQDVVLGSTYQRFITAFFVELIDSGIWDELDDLGERFAYQHLHELKLFAERTSDETWEHDYEELLGSIE